MQFLKFWTIGAFALMLSLGATSTTVNAEGYGVRNGDVLRIEVLEDPSLNRSVLVAPDGRITIPMAGSIRARGRTVGAIQRNLATLLASNFALPPNVYVSVEKLADRVSRSRTPAAEATIDIYLVGEAAKPGKLAVSSGTTLLQLFAEMGGFSKFAATKRIQLRRTDPRTKAQTVYKFNYKAIETNASSNGNTELQDGDVIIIPQRRLFE